MKPSGVYFYLRYDGTPYYVGKGSRRRAAAWHRTMPPKDPARILYQEFLNEDEAFEAECFFINFFGRLDLGTGCLRNFTDGGEGTSGTIVSEETRHKLSAIWKG